MRFRLVVYMTDADNKFEASRAHEYLGDEQAIYHLWYTFSKICKHKHVEIYNLMGVRLDPEIGISCMVDYSV